MSRTIIDLTGKIFGRLTVLYRNGSDKNSRPLWECICSCGKHHTVKGNSLRIGDTKSCGCLKIESFIERRKKYSEENDIKVPTILYNTYHNMMSRCYNIKNKLYYRYGGRGIFVCDRWKGNYENFYNDMIKSYKEGLEIDRIDNDVGYFPENCRWVTRTQNIRNNSKTKLTQENVDFIRLNKELSTKYFANLFNVHISTIKSVKSNKNWKEKF